jgi:hypothetical protein
MALDFDRFGNFSATRRWAALVGTPARVDGPDRKP